MMSKVGMNVFVCPKCSTAPCACVSEEYCMEVAPSQRIVKPCDAAEINPDDESIHIIGTRSEKVTVISGIEHMTKLKCLVLRSCLISKMNGIESLINLEKLELYDNQIEAINSIETLSNLTIIDLSYNSIREMVNLSCCPLLEELYIAQNKLRKVEGLEQMIHLKTLDLGANRIRVMEGLENLTNLRSLWLGKNKIEKVECVSSLKNLQQLDIQSNRLSELSTEMIHLVSLKELYLAHNGLNQVIGCLPIAAPLHTIDLSSNPITSIAGLEGLHNTLLELWMTSTQLSSWQDLEPLKHLQKLTCVYLEHSPISKEPDYEKTIVTMLPNLEQLDANSVER